VFNDEFSRVGAVGLGMVLIGSMTLPPCAGVLTGSLSNWTSAYYSSWSRMDEEEGHPRMFKGGKEDLSCYYGTFRGK